VTGRCVALVTALIVGVAGSGPAQELRIPVRLDRPAGVAAPSWPVTFGVPFASGQCKDAAALTVVDDKGRPAPCQIVKTGDWPDGSVRWALVDLTADFTKQYTLTTGARAAGGAKIALHESGDGRLRVDTGPATYAFGKTGGCFEGITHGEDGHGEALVKDAGRAFYLIDNKGRRATLSMGRMGVVLAGERRSVVRVEGEYVTDAGERVAAAIIYCHFYAGLPWARISHKLIVTEDTNAVWFREIGMRLPVATQGGTTASFNNEHDKPASAAAYAIGPGQEIAMAQVEFPHFASEKSRYAITRHAGGKVEELGAGAACGDWADLSDGRQGLAAQVPAFAETFPKAFRISDGALTVKFWASESGKELDFRPAQLMKEYFGNDWIPADDPAAKQKTSAKGTARTHEVWLYPHRGALDAPTASSFGATRQEIYAAADPAWVAQSGVMGPWHPFDPDRFGPAEKVIDDYYQRAVMVGQRLFPATGYLHWGCYPYSAQPWEVKNGRWYPTIHRLSRSLEYNLKRHVWVLFARSAERRYHDYARWYTRLQHDLLWSNWDLDEKRKTRGKLYQGSFHSPVLWGEGAAYLAFASSEDTIQFVYDYFLSGDLHSRDMVLWWKEAMARDWKHELEEPLKLFPPVVGLRMIGSAYELDRDPKLYDYGHRLMEALVDPKAPMGLKPEPKQNYGKAGDVLSVFYYYYVSTRDPLALIPMLRLAEFDYINGRLNFLGRSSAEAYAYALAWRETKERRYATYLGELLRREHGRGRGAQTLERLGVDLNAVDQRFNKPWGHVTMTGSGPVFVGLPVAMQAVLDAGMPTVARPLAAKPLPTQKTRLLLKKVRPGAAWIEVSINNVGDRAFAPALRDDRGAPAALETLDRREYRDTKPPGVAGYGGGMYSPYYGMHESFIYLKLRIPASVKPGIYELDLGDETTMLVLDSDIEQMLQVAPDGLPLQDGQRNYFPVAPGTTAIEFTAPGETTLRDPDGRETQVETLDAQSGRRRFATGGRHGTWCVESAGDQFVRLLNAPFLVALEDPTRLFDVDAARYPSSEPPGLRAAPDPKQPFVAGRFGKSAFLLNQFVSMPLAPQPPAGGNAAPPMPAGTIEFWWRPHWSVSDLNPTKNFVQRLYLLHLKPFGVMWTADDPLRSDAYYDAGTLAFQIAGLPGAVTRAKFYPVAGTWYHLAVTWNVDGRNSEMDIFINGRKRSFFDYHDGLMRAVTADKLPPTGDTLKFGSGHFHGRVVSGEEFDELRISSVVRYREDFIPPQAPFVADKDTRLLMRLDGNAEGVLDGAPAPGKLSGPLGGAACRLF
jgi:hypothetical protein